MRVLILHQHFKHPSTGGALRSYFLAKALVDKGNHAIVITGSEQKHYTQTVLEGIEVHELPVSYDNAFGFYERSASFLQYIFHAVRVARKIEGIDLCYAISVPLTIGIAARWLKFTRRIPYIFEVGDLWPDAPVQMGFVNSSILRRLLEQLERSCYREASAIVALSPPIRDAVQQRAPGKKIFVVPNMADCEYFSPSPKQSDRSQLVVSYIGAVGLANGLDYFLECANICRRASLPVRFVLCGDGALLERLKGNIKQLGLTNITVTGFLNREGVRGIMTNSDIAFVCYKNLPVLQTGSPNKFFDGLAAGKAIFINFGGWIKQEIEEAGCGVALDPADPTDFRRKIEPYLRDPSVLAKAQQAARRLAESKYARKKLADYWIEAIRQSGKN